MRTVFTLVAIGIGLVFCLAVFFGNRPDGQGESTDGLTDSTPAQEVAVDPPPIQPTPTQGKSDPQSQKNPQVTDLATKTADTTQPPHSATAAPTDPSPPTFEGLQPRPATKSGPSIIGSVDDTSPYRLEAELTGWGAAVRYIRLNQYTTAVSGGDPYVIQQPVEATYRDNQGVETPFSVFPFAARSVIVNGIRVNLEKPTGDQPAWELIAPGTYQMTLEDLEHRPVLSITRRYWIDDHQAVYDLRCDQTLENLTDQPLRVVWEQYAQGDMPQNPSAYMGDRRTLVAGYRNFEYNPAGQFVYVEDTFLPRLTVIDAATGPLPVPGMWVSTTARGLAPLWPNDDLPAPDQRSLAWLAAMNRYFAAVVYRPATEADNPDATASRRPRSLDADFPVQGMRIFGSMGNGADDKRVMAFTLTSRPIKLAPHAAESLDLSLYAGPRKSEVFEAQPYASLELAKLVVYNLGGPCAFCTFQWLAQGLLAFLKVLHVITFDWGVSIIILVLVVRAILHPITKKSQVNMMKMGKQMQSIQPELEKLKKKYGEDPKRFQQEQMKLWREKGINPAGMLGCLPMFLQTPIWIALYAMLYYAIELRHQPAFYGLFQGISGGQWNFLADLSTADRFLQFYDHPQSIQLFMISFDYSSLNILPLLMAVVFYFQQKLTTPPPANEQAAQQQKIMKFMVLLFPIMLYSAPSGLTLYILASTAAGIVDSYIVRKHIKEAEETGTLFEKKQPKPGGFMDRMQKAIAAKQAEMMQMQQSGQSGSGGGNRAAKRRSRK